MASLPGAAELAALPAALVALAPWEATDSVALATPEAADSVALAASEATLETPLVIAEVIVLVMEAIEVTTLEADEAAPEAAVLTLPAADEAPPTTPPTPKMVVEPTMLVSVLPPLVMMLSITEVAIAELAA